MTNEEALSKDDTLIALRNDVLRLPSTVVIIGGEQGPVLVRIQDVLQLLTKYFKS